MTSSTVVMMTWHAGKMTSATFGSPALSRVGEDQTSQVRPWASQSTRACRPTRRRQRARTRASGSEASAFAWRTTAPGRPPAEPRFVLQ